MHRCLFLLMFHFFALSLMGQERPNILLIVSEDNGPELSSYGAPVQTPNLDKLAQEGILFENAYVTQAGCSQSRASFLTGLYPHQNGQIGLATWLYQMYDPDTPNIPSSLKKQGYRTGIIGKLHINPEDSFPFDFKRINKSNFSREDLDAYARYADEFINGDDAPFFLQVNHPDAHAPFLSRVNGIPAEPLTGEDVDALPYMLLDHPKLKEATANYYNCLMRLDHYVGQLLDVLEESGRSENTLVIYIGDHGADLLRGKRTSYEGGLRIPMIMRWKGLPESGSREQAMVSTIDLFPTILELSGLSVPGYLPGRSLLPILTGNEPIWRQYLFTEYHVHSNHNPYPQRTVRDEQYKLIYNPLAGTENPGYQFTLEKLIGLSEDELLQGVGPEVRKAYNTMKSPPEYELYDLSTDPFETINLANEEEYAAELNRLKAELADWQKRTNDPLIDKDVARQLFDMIMKVGTERKVRIPVPYLELMDPDLEFK